MYSSMTWRVFDSLIRAYCKADQNTPKPKTFRQFCNARLLQLMAVLDGLDDPRYARSHIMQENSVQVLYKGNITTVNVGTATITQSTVVWPVGAILSIVMCSTGNVYSHAVCRVLSKVGTDYVVDVLSGTLLTNDSDLLFLAVRTEGSTGLTWDSSSLRLRAVRGVSDYRIVGGVPERRMYFGFTRYEIWRDLGKDYGMDAEIGWYNLGGVFEFQKGSTADAIAVAEVEFDGVPSLYTELTGSNTIELLPEHMRMLFDGVAAQTLTVLNKPQPEDLKARLRDDMMRLYGAKKEEAERSMDRNSRTSV